MTRPFATTSVALAFLLVAAAAPAQGTTPPTTPQRGRGGGNRGGPPWRTAADTARAHRLYISTDPQDLPKSNAGADARVRTDSILADRTKGVLDFRIVSYKSDVDGLEIPAYVFAPLKLRGEHRHAAIVWVHGYVHGRFEERHLPFVKEAVARGYVVVAPNYRGSLGFTDAFANLIDYGGKEIDDAESAYTYIKSSLPFVDPSRVGIIGWSHGGFITSHILFRDNQPFKAGVANVPVTNLIFRLSTHQPNYTQPFASNPDVGGMPSDHTCGRTRDSACVPFYVQRSPVFHVANLKVPMMVNVATNDCDVDFIEDQQMVYTLRALKPDLADTKIYQDPPYLLANGGDGHDQQKDGSGILGGCGHTFTERVETHPTSPRYLQRIDSPEQIDVWNRIWGFFEKNLNPANGK
jgi:dipeptidyl aminopeptidase/acylaminoacyl peptidase